MENTLIEEIEDSLEAFSRDPKYIFSLADKLDEGNWDSLTDQELGAINICIDFTVGCLAGYIQEIEKVE